MFTGNVSFPTKDLVDFIIPITKLCPEVTPGSQLQGRATHLRSTQIKPRKSPETRLWVMVSFKTTQIDIQVDKPQCSGQDGDFESRYRKLPLGPGFEELRGPDLKASSEVEFADHRA